MRAKIKYFLKTMTSPKIRALLKKKQRRVKNIIKFNANKATIESVRDLLIIDFNIKKGDNLIVSSSFGNLNADFSPVELINLLQEIVGTKGNIVMPFYPPLNSYEWASSGKIFDMKETRSGMGILTQKFSEMPGVVKSKHPTKAVVAWGANSEEIVKNHENSKTPFYWDSPYGWLIQNGSKSIGLGLKNIPIFHTFEDIILKESEQLYQKKQLLKIRLHNGTVEEFEVSIHDPEKLMKLMDAGDYVKKISPESYNRKDFGYTFCYCADNTELFNICNHEFLNNNFRYKK